MAALHILNPNLEALAKKMQDIKPEVKEEKEQLLTSYIPTKRPPSGFVKNW
ncbi:hypothetical protein [Rickettsia endosymbiont of Polydrusus tereticollis]|uniref:hypothetical protein n=1 Tax=Rickettsia endosymbiont of Polydrusus tereticollis TaxID=3066251 RepID=UPI0031333D47